MEGATAISDTRGIEANLAFPIETAFQRIASLKQKCIDATNSIPKTIFLKSQETLLSDLKQPVLEIRE